MALLYHMLFSVIIKNFCESCSDDHKPVEEKKLATWGTDVSVDLVLDENCLLKLLKIKINLPFP